MKNAIRVKGYECYTYSLSFLFGKTPRVDMICGHCEYLWSKRFVPLDFRHGHPESICPYCNVKNYVPITLN